jgi:hypothetical protein
VTFTITLGFVSGKNGGSGVKVFRRVRLKHRPHEGPYAVVLPYADSESAAVGNFVLIEDVSIMSVK